MLHCGAGDDNKCAHKMEIVIFGWANKSKISLAGNIMVVCCQIYIKRRSSAQKIAVQGLQAGFGGLRLKYSSDFG